jgi:hypothetical protein
VRTATSAATTTPATVPALAPAAAPTTCADTWEKGTLLVKENKPGKEKLLAKLIKGPAVDQLDLGSPLAPGGSAHTVCVYDDADAVVGRMDVDRAGDDCGGKPCWKAIGGAPPDGKGYLYKDGGASADGIKILLMKGGDAGKSKILIKGANNSSKGQTSLPAGIAAGLSFRSCWSPAFRTPTALPRCNCARIRSSRLRIPSAWSVSS